jgi:hypothetical protein
LEDTFKDLESAEKAVKAQVCSISDQYIQALKKVLPTLKKASAQSALTQRDTSTFLTLYNQANDHLHNLVQLKEEVQSYGPSEQGLVLEVSSEVLGNAVGFLTELTNTIGSTKLYSSTPEQAENS